MDAILFQIEIYWVDTKIEGYPLDRRLGGPQSRSGIVVVVVVNNNNNSILYYLCAESTATSSITDTTV
jgi:hypothetical protein